VQRHERFLEPGKSVSAARADQGSHQFVRGPGESEIHLARNGRPVRVMLSRALVPFPVQVGEQASRGVEPVHRAGARRRHVDIEDPGKRRLAGEEREIGPARDPDYLLVAGPGGQGARRGYHLGDHELPAFGGRGQEAVLLVREVGIEGRPGHPGPPHDVGDRHGQVTGLRHRGDHRPQQPFPLRRAHGRRRQAAPAPGQAWLSLVRPGQRALLPGVGHGLTVADVALKYCLVLLVKAQLAHVRMRESTCPGAGTAFVRP